MKVLVELQSKASNISAALSILLSRCVFVVFRVLQEDRSSDCVCRSDTIKLLLQ